MIYEWQCPQCQKVREVVSSIARRNRRQYCEDGHDTTAMERIISSPPIVIGDIEPYRAATGDVALKGERPMIGSRSEHKAFLKRNKLVEVGDAPIRSTKEMRKVKPNREELRADIRKALRAKFPRSVLQKTS